MEASLQDPDLAAAGFIILVFFLVFGCMVCAVWAFGKLMWFFRPKQEYVKVEPPYLYDVSFWEERHKINLRDFPGSEHLALRTSVARVTSFTRQYQSPANQ